MTSKIGPDAASDYGYDYYNSELPGGYHEYTWESDQWRAFFRMVAQRVVATLAPSTVHDVGCAKGLLVQALVEAGVDARGSDISECAVTTAHPDVRDRLRVASATEPVGGRVDLVTCIEVLEHMPAAEAQTAIDQICAATDRVLFSSTPAGFAEPTHINVQPTSRWASWFAERGFFRRTDVDATFLAPWAVVFERAEVTPATLVERYESLVAPVQAEAIEKRNALTELDRTLTELRSRLRELEGNGLALAREVQLSDARLLASHAELVARDNVIGLEASVAALERSLDKSRDRLTKVRESLVKERAANARLRRRLRAASAEVQTLRSSRTWRVGRAVTAPLGKFKR